MRQRTRSRSRAWSQNGTSAEEDDIALALQRFLDKLRQFQPLFTEEDVVAISFPAEGSGSSCGSSPSSSTPISPRLSPSRLDNEELQMELDRSDTAPASPPPLDDRLAKKAPPLLTRPATASHAVGSSIDLDGPLSSSLFVTAVNLFDAKMLAKNRRISTDALRLVRQGYALIWQDADYLATLLNGEPYRSPGVSQRGHGASAPELPASRRGSHNTRRVLFSAAAPSPGHRPNRQLALLLDECIRVLLVYANVSVNFCQSVSTNSRLLLLLSFVCCTARRLEEGDDELDEEGRGTAADIVVGDRNLHAEMDGLEQAWQGCGIEGRVADTLQECYLIEFLLDAALPPAVCSSRYDGLLATVIEKKRRVVSDIATSRSGFSHLMRAAPLRGLCGLASMSACSDAKLRARLLDRMALEGVVERLSGEITAAMEAALCESDPLQPSLSPAKRRRSVASRSTSPPRQRSRPSASAPSSRPASPAAAQEARPARSSDVPREPAGLERLLATQQSTPVERIGQCVDILIFLSSPNLCPHDSSETSSPRNSTAPQSGVVRATAWASHEAALHEISLHLLAICFLSKSHVRYAQLASLQLYAADCVLQWAAYSGKFYTMIVQSLDELLDMIESVDDRTSDPTVSPPPATSRSPSRSPPAAKHGAHSVPGHRLLRLLLPGDETGLLPLLIHLLQYTIHAEANATSVERWFRFLAARILPGVFEVPQLTSGRRSTSEWGRQRQEEQRQRRSQATSRSSSLPPTSAPSASIMLSDAEGHYSAPVLARDLTRAEAVAVAPYFRFVRQVVEESSWRAGTAALVGKVVLLAFNVIVTQGYRCNLVFGQACACYDVAAPLLLSMQTKSSQRESWQSVDEGRTSSYRSSTVLMHQLQSEAAETGTRRASQLRTPAKALGISSEADGKREDASQDEEVFVASVEKRRSPAKGGRRQSSPKKRRSASRPLSPAQLQEEEEADFSPFISSPSGSPLFYEARSPSTAATAERRDGSEGTRSPSRRQQRGSDLRAALEEAATPPPPLPSRESPGAVTHSWTGRLSLSALLSSISGHEEAPLQGL